MRDLIFGAGSNNGASPSRVTVSRSRRRNVLIGRRISTLRRGERLPFLFPLPLDVGLNELYQIIRGFVKALGAATVGSESHKHAILPPAAEEPDKWRVFGRALRRFHGDERNGGAQ